MALSQREIDKRSGHEATFWRNVDKREDGRWMWNGQTNNNHNTVDCESYDYGVYELVSRETANLSKPKKIHKSNMAHRISVYLTYGVEIPSDRKTGFDVFPINGEHLDINPSNLGVRSIATGQEWTAAVFCAANDNYDTSLRDAA
jgi:hypothetical protein